MLALAAVTLAGWAGGLVRHRLRAALAVVTRVVGAGVEVVAQNGEVATAIPCIAAVGGARVAIAALPGVDGADATKPACGGTRTKTDTRFGTVLAADTFLAPRVRTSIAVITRSDFDTAGLGVTGTVQTGSVVFTNQRIVLAAIDGIARVKGAN